MIRAARVDGMLWRESIVDGPGVRLVIFLSGCLHECPGCHNAWLCDPDAGESYSEQEVVSELVALYSPLWHDGLTISGGDPFYQSIELALLLSLIRKELPAVNIWIYTGYLLEQLDGEPALLYCDVLVDGPFVAARANEGQIFCGSGNQRIIPLRDGTLHSLPAVPLRSPSERQES